MSAGVREYQLSYGTKRHRINIFLRSAIYSCGAQTCLREYLTFLTTSSYLHALTCSSLACSQLAILFSDSCPSLVDTVRFDIITLFPDFFASPLESGLVGRALERGIAETHITNPRDFAYDKHRRVDDEPYGGGVGMLMKPDPLFAAVESLPVLPKRDVILLTPQGEPMHQAMFQQLTTYDQLVLVCGHYEGVDERVRTHLATREVSLGDFVLTCGEIPALALLNGVLRLQPGTVGKPDSIKFESFETALLDYPQYTRPASFRGWDVPPVLTSGNHQAIAQWRRQQQQERTRQRRPDLYQRWQAETAEEEQKR